MYTQGVTLYGVDAQSATDVWAVGVGYTELGDGPVVEFWNGSAWRDESSIGGLPAGSDLRSVWAQSPTNVWVGGDDGTGNPMLAHFDGTSWAIAGIETPIGSDGGWWFEVDDILPVPGTARAWGVGPFYAYQYSGGVWTFKSMPGYSSVDALTVPAQRDSWAVGPSDTGGITEHFNGTIWTKFFSKGVYLQAIGASSATNIWAVSSTTFGGPYSLRLDHLVSNKWKPDGSALPVDEVGQMRLTGAGSGYLAGGSSADHPELIAFCGL